MKTEPTNQTNIGSNSEDFQIVDSKGRKIGAMVHTFEMDYVESEAGWSNQAAGHYFVLCPQALRNGRHFGAAQHDQLFTTEEARNKARAKYFAGARKRAAKISKLQDDTGAQGREEDGNP